MKKHLFFLFLLFFMFSCATETKFPVSDVTPAASIEAKMKQDKNSNYLISVTAKNLASPGRLDPPKNVYVVWINTENNGVKNMGQLVNKNGQKSSLETLTVFEPKEIFITAEEEGNISYPAGIEISRVSM